jgi:hypothetical protein
MEKITLQRQVFSKRQIDNVINTDFTQLVQPTSNVTSSLNISVSEFFDQYKLLFFDIPKFGDINSHEYLIKTSGEYIGGQQNNDIIQALIDEVTQLRQENLELQQKTITASVSQAEQALKTLQKLNG